MPPVSVECFLLGELDGHIAFDEGDDGQFAPSWTAEVRTGSPQEVVASTAPVELLATPHSTSWRFEDEVVVLTFVAFPAVRDALRRPRPAPALRQISRGAATVTQESVVAHAIRHVAFLVVTDPGFRSPDPARWATLVRSHVPDVFRDLSIG